MKKENMKEHSYMAFLQEAKQFIPQERIYTDELRRLAWGTDAGFYRLIPQIVIRSKDEDEVSQLLKLASRHGLPVTFRAAGTSLSGQAISDSILIVAGKNWEKIQHIRRLRTDNPPTGHHRTTCERTVGSLRP